MSTLRPRFGITLSLLALAGCGGSSKSVALGDAGVEDASADADLSDVACGSIPSHPVGLKASTKTSGIVAQVVKVDFDPPRKFDNDWVIALTDKSGAPIHGAIIKNPDTYMPKHNHPGGFTPVVSELATEPGHYEFKGIYFSMTGPWEVLFDVGTGGAAPELVVINVCVGE
jgi:hypothetical protein